MTKDALTQRPGLRAGSLEPERGFNRAIRQAADDATKEAEGSAMRWPSYNSAHEGLAVIHEEFDELKAHVWTKQPLRDLAAMRKEAIQVAAPALRFAADCCDEEVGRR